MKRITGLLLVISLAVCCFAACSAQVPTASDSGKDFYGGNYENADFEQMPSTEIPGGTNSTGVKDQKLIRTVSIEAETDDLDAVLTLVQARIHSLNGYIEEQTVRGRSDNRYAHLTVRIPVDQMDGFVEHISGSSNVTYYQESTDDVTLEYVATESRITALETERDRLLELMEKAGNMSDLLKIEERLTEVLTELEKVTSQLRLYDNLVDYGTIHLSISQVVEFTVVEDQDVWQRIATGFSSAMSDLANGVVEIFVGIVIAVPYMIPFAVAGVVLLVVLKIRKRKKTAKAEKDQLQDKEV